MKNAVLLLLLGALCLAMPSVVIAQQSASPAVPTRQRDSLLQAYQTYRQVRKMRRMDEYTDNKGRPIRYNVVKVDVPNWAFGEPNAGYERKLGHHTTATLHTAFTNARYQQDDQGPKASLPKQIFYPAQAHDRQFATVARAIKLMPEFRYYIGRNAPRGFFVGAYYYYANINWQLERQATDATGVPTVATAESRTSAHGPGLVWGIQSIVLTRVTLGFEMGAALLMGLRSEKTPLSPALPNDRGGTMATPAVPVIPIIPRFNFQLGYCFGR